MKDVSVVPPSQNMEVLDTKKAFTQALKKEYAKIIQGTLFSLTWSGIFIKFLPSKFASSDFGFIIIILPWIILFLFIGAIYAVVREAFWKQLALKYNWEYTSRKKITGEKALLFKTGRPTLDTQHGIKGVHNNQPFHIFEYAYEIGSGKNKATYSFTVFEIKFTGTFPHIYLNYKNDWYSNTPAVFSSLAKISVPREFEKKFKLYAPKEYEIEVLEIFTPEVFSLLIDLKCNYDMEFVDGELVVYTNKRFSNFKDLDMGVTEIKKVVDILSPRLNRLELTQIGDISPLLKN